MHREVPCWVRQSKIKLKFNKNIKKEESFLNERLVSGQLENRNKDNNEEPIKNKSKRKRFSLNFHVSEQE